MLPDQLSTATTPTVAPLRATPTEIPSRPSGLLTPEGQPALTDWSLDSGVRHLNHGSFGAVPRAAQRIQQDFQRIMDANPCDWFMNLGGRVAQARLEIASFLNTDADATALVPNVSAGVSVVYANVPAWSGMTIVTTDHTYGAVLMGAERLARRWNGTVVTVHIPLNASNDDAFDLLAAELNDNVGLIVLDHVTSSTARQFPVGRIAALGRQLNIPVLVDAAHSPALFADPVDGIDADFWVGNLHKFACAPRGTAAIVASGEHTQKLFPVIDSWGSPEPYPTRFDQQGTIDVTPYLAAPSAFALVQEHYGWDEARRYITELGDYAQAIVTEALSAEMDEDAAVDVGEPVNGLRLIRLPRGLATTLEGSHDLRHLIAQRLGIETAITSWAGHGYLRLSTHVYNTADDFEDFVERAVPFIAEQGRSAQRG
ncbi:aminotransferase class V-fold PLP-dependent enzyme [Salinibacterium sp. G-O1]|uniref:aminotransferase class V-fold PLP-dependent enzyme n=1 Tax=Salinibacterium sp. G-O1 TaxID=3046208 RepID=UPI0024BB9C93|nr:aminotransferase class V-fold PLP-dependent enzyme [Salinibacterium sp. G-O1]MDJ0334319.1 aminotransferase class V-fold PLP-dependent enzyme [Salinibacterium sp. G-O1]